MCNSKLMTVLHYLTHQGGQVNEVNINIINCSTHSIMEGWQIR